jgi:hypothetical protein
MNNTEEMSFATMKNMNVEEFIIHITTFRENMYRQNYIS